MEENSKPQIWIDADACPKVIKEIVFKASNRLQLKVILVANAYMKIPADPLISLIQVEQGADVADQYIVEQAKERDLVITADIPLAALLVKKNVIALDQRGELYNEDNIEERLSMRNFMDELRSGGVTTQGPKPFSAQDKARFASSFDRTLTKRLRQVRSGGMNFFS